MKIETPRGCEKDKNCCCELWSLHAASPCTEASPRRAARLPPLEGCPPAPHSWREPARGREGAAQPKKDDAGKGSSVNRTDAVE